MRPTEIDKLVGQRIRAGWWRLGITQAELGKRIGIVMQQISKIESGENRVSAAQLFAISQALEMPLTEFFEGMDLEPPSQDAMRIAGRFDKLSGHHQHLVQLLVEALEERGQ